MMMSLGTQSKNLGVGKVLNLSNTCINIVCINIFICVCIYSLAKTLMVVHGLTPTCLPRILHQVETKYMPLHGFYPMSHHVSMLCTTHYNRWLSELQINIFHIINIVSCHFKELTGKNGVIVNGNIILVAHISDDTLPLVI